MMHDKYAIATRAVVSGRGDTHPGAPLNVPITLASNFLAASPSSGPEYARDDGTPTWVAFEEAIGALEGGTATAYASGMAAVSAVMSLIPAGSIVVAPVDVYQGVTAWLHDAEQRLGWSVRRVAVADTAGWASSAPGAALVWLESPSNPMLETTDLEAVIDAAKQAGALVAVDNTFATPVAQLPLGHGADVVVHSATKFIGGHSDLLAGVAIARDEEIVRRLRRHRQVMGATPGALETFLALRGLRTLPLRFERAEHNAGRLVSLLESHAAVGAVRYPGFGAIISFDVGSSADEAEAVCRAVKLMRHATSLGGVESTIERRAKLAGQTHVPANLLRLSVGIEDPADLEDDLRQALDGRTTRSS